MHLGSHATSARPSALGHHAINAEEPRGFLRPRARLVLPSAITARFSATTLTVDCSPAAVTIASRTSISFSQAGRLLKWTQKAQLERQPCNEQGFSQQIAQVDEGA